MKKVLAMLLVGLESSSVKTPELKALSSAFKSALKKELDSIGATLEGYSLGHFDMNGFFKKDEQLYYFSFGDVRGMEFTLARGSKVLMMYRKAQHLKDWSGYGGNNWIEVQEGMGKNLRLS